MAGVGIGKISKDKLKTVCSKKMGNQVPPFYRLQHGYGI